MNITVTFTDTAGTHIPEGAVLAFDDVAEWDLRAPSDVEVTGRTADGTVRAFTGTARLHLSASSRATRPLWAFPGAVT